MKRKHLVRSGESAPLIAARGGFSSWSAIAEDPDNAALEQLRGKDGVVFPGDEVWLPDVRPKTCSAKVGAPSRFVVRRPQGSLSLAVRNGELSPLSDKPFELRSRFFPTIEGTTTSAGRVECSLPPETAAADLIIWNDKNKSGPRLVWHLTFGTLEAPESLTGVLQRLTNLGYTLHSQASTPGFSDEGLRLALRAFQDDAGLPVTGEPDAQTLEHLVKEHGI